MRQNSIVGTLVRVREGAEARLGLGNSECLAVSPGLEYLKD